MKNNKNIERTGPRSARAAKSYDVSVESLASAVEEAIRSLKRWEIEASSNGGVRAVRSTRVFKFEDDVNITVSGSGEESHATFESASRVGNTDLGQNPRNLKELIEAVNRELPKKP